MTKLDNDVKPQIQEFRGAQNGELSNENKATGERKMLKC